MNTSSRGEVGLARKYFAVQAVAGAAWWIGVFTSDVVREWTLGSWDPRVLVVPDLVFFVGGSALAAARRSWQFAIVTAAWTVLLTVALLGYGLIERTAGWGVLLMGAASLGSVAGALTLRFGRMPRGWFFVGPFRFTPSRRRSSAGNLIASVIQLVIFWITFFILMPWLLITIENRLRVSWQVLAEPPWAMVGLVLFLVAAPLGLWSCWVMATLGEGTPLPAQTARELVVSGPYRFLRNPMAAAGVLQAIGMGLFFGTWTMIVATIVGAVTWHVGIRPAEEADLLARFGEPYERYRRAVRLWLPAPLGLR